jgi:hypothetical protein
MMQKATFDGGGYVLHKITGSFSGRASAWFDAYGKMLDAEQITPRGSVRTLKRNSPMWKELALRGKDWR